DLAQKPAEAVLRRGPRRAPPAGLGLVNLIAPNSGEERIQRIDDVTTAFVYAVSVTGLTGSGFGSVENVEAYLRRARQLVTANPLLVGFGIKTHEDAERLSQNTDGFIVGSALIEHVEKLWADRSLSTKARLSEVRRFVAALKHGNEVSAAGTPGA
ncbi:MAG: tryptophan synthase subunit alpha, partial [Rhodothermales bacterium]